MTPKFRLTDLPIPFDTVPGGAGWSPSMMEMVAHIGAYRTLLICEYFGGKQVYVPLDYLRNSFLPVIGLEAAKTVSHVYGRQDIIIPLARIALAVARRAPVVAAVREGHISIGVGAEIVGMRRDNFSRIISKTAEGFGVAPLELPLIRNADMLHDAAAIAIAALEQAGSDPRVIDVARDAIVQLGNIQTLREMLADGQDALEWLRLAKEARDKADLRGGSLVEAYTLMSVAAAAGSREADALLLDMGEEMTPWQRSIARGNARWWVGLRKVEGESFGGPARIPLHEALKSARSHLGLNDIAPADAAPQLHPDPENQEEEDT